MGGKEKREGGEGRGSVKRSRKLIHHVHYIYGGRENYQFGNTSPISSVSHVTDNSRFASLFYFFCSCYVCGRILLERGVTKTQRDILKRQKQEKNGKGTKK